jgi:RNA polymerase sigma-70 factor (ECF subfamily)
MPDVDPLQPYLAAALEGDDVALGHLVRATQPAVWRLCSVLGSPGTVDDLVQDTYLRALKALPTFRGDTLVQVWLLSIARRACADDVRRRQRARRLTDRLTRYVVPATVDMPDRLDDLVDDLQADRREAFILTQMLGLSYEEAAQVMDCPIGTIRSRVARARADLAVVVAEAEAR